MPRLVFLLHTSLGARSDRWSQQACRLSTQACPFCTPWIFPAKWRHLTFPEVPDAALSDAQIQCFPEFGTHFDVAWEDSDKACDDPFVRTAIRFNDTSYLLPSSTCDANCDSRRAISTCRPSATCWYRIAISAVECPSRSMSSRVVAPAWAANTAPV